MTLKKHKGLRIILASLLGAGLLVSPILASELSYAETCTSSDTTACTTVTVTIDEVLSITNASSLQDVDLGSGTVGTPSIDSGQNVIVSTNAAGGYKLLIKTTGTDKNGTATNKLLIQTNKAATGIDSVSAKGSLSNGTWGWSINGTVFRPFITTDSAVMAYSTGPVENATTKLYFGAQASNNLTAGEYSNTVLLTLLANDGTAKTIYGD